MRFTKMENQLCIILRIVCWYRVYKLRSCMHYGLHKSPMLTAILEIMVPTLRFSLSAPCMHSLHYCILRWMDWCDAMRAHTDVPDATVLRNTLRYVYGICLTWLINSPSMAWSSCATPEFRSERTSRDLETFTSHVTYTSCDVDTLRTTSSQRCHSCVTFVC